MWNLKRRRGFSLIELLIVIAIILIIITIALPRLTRARMYTQEVAAIAAIRTIHTAETQYYSQFSRYATSLAELGPPASGSANASAADMIGNDLANGKKAGLRLHRHGKPGRIHRSSHARGLQYRRQPHILFRSDHGGARALRPEPATAQDPESK
jgi:type IV pilus assembly protein PilA